MKFRQRCRKAYLGRLGEGDLLEGLTVIDVARAGTGESGHLAFPVFHVADDMRTRDVLLVAVHERPGHTPIICNEWGRDGRLSTVLYLRHNMPKCGTADEERL